jgi:hypothetical protein
MEIFNNQTKIQNLFNGLKQCNPISDKLLMRLFERLGINSN